MTVAVNIILFSILIPFMRDIIFSYFLTVLACNLLSFDMITVRTSSTYSSQWQCCSGRKKTLKSTSQISILRDPFGACVTFSNHISCHVPILFTFPPPSILSFLPLFWLYISSLVPSHPSLTPSLPTFLPTSLSTFLLFNRLFLVWVAFSTYLFTYLFI